MRRTVSIDAALLMCALAASPAVAALEFTPAAGYAASEVWAGTNGAHFAVDSGRFYIYGAEQVGGGQSQSVVRLFDGTSTVEIARSPIYATGAYYPDAVTVVGGNVYWVNAQSYTAGLAASVYKTSFVGGAWTTTQVLDDSAGINVFSLSTNGSNVFGVGLDAGGSNVAFYLDDADSYDVLASIPADGTGGSGFDRDGNFFAGAWSVGGDFASHMYEFSARQIADRLSGAQATPYAAGDAIGDHVVPSNASAVMESDGLSLFGSEYNTTWTGMDPFAYDLDAGTSSLLGTLAGAEIAVAGDLYCRDGGVFFMGKDDWTIGGEAVIYRVVPEPRSLFLLALVAGLALRRRSGWGMARAGGGR